MWRGGQTPVALTRSNKGNGLLMGHVKERKMAGQGAGLREIWVSTEMAWRNQNYFLFFKPFSNIHELK
jgi:hypothetical protein